MANVNESIDGNKTLFGVLNTLGQNSDKNFVQRIIQPDSFPKLFDNPGGILGAPSTHSMTWGTDEQGNAFVYPTVVQEGDKLRRLNADEAWKHAVDNNERIPFQQDHEQADWFSKNYKQVWNIK